MQFKTQTSEEEFDKNFSRRKLWQRVVSFLTCISVFCTTYALILPAITLSAEADCGIEAHTHTDECYELTQVKTQICDSVHKHTSECRDENGELICGKADFVLHTHGTNCYDAQGNLVCNLENLEEHTHTDACYTFVPYDSQETEKALVCDMPEGEGHTHTDECYGEPVLSCGLEQSEGHTHGEECYGEPILVCEDTSEEHTHTSACYVENLICTLPEMQPHEHNDDCYTANCICSLHESEAHTHGESCYGVVTAEEAEQEGEWVLTCTKKEVKAHTHTDACYETHTDEDGETYTVLTCTELEVLSHQHSDDCFETTQTRGELTCGKEEHVHTDECYASVIESLNAQNPANYNMNQGDVSSVSDDSYEAGIMSDATKETNLKDALGNNKIEVSITNPVYNPETDSFLVDFKMDFTMPNAAFDKMATGEYGDFLYTVPSGTQVPDALLDTVRQATDNNAGGRVAFDYWFTKNADGNYVIHIRYREDYIKYITEKVDSDSTCNVEFEGIIGSSSVITGKEYIDWTDSDGNIVHIPVTNGTYPENQVSKYDIQTSKTGSYVSADGTLVYKVRVSSKKGTDDEIRFTDTLDLRGLKLDGSEPVINVTSSSGETISGLTVSTDGSKSIISGTLPKLSADGYYDITYTYKLSEVPTGNTYYPYNVAKAVTSTPEGDISSSSDSKVTVKKDMVRKQGVYDSATGNITWTVVVNPDGNDISGYKLTDAMLKEALSFSITPNDGSFEAIRDEESGVVLGFLFKTLDGETANNRTYTLVYTTKPTPGTSNQEVKNTVTVQPNDPNDSPNKPSDSKDVTVNVPAKGTIAKTGEMSGGILNWKITIDVPEGGIDKGTVIKDLHAWSWDSVPQKNHGMDPKQITALNDALASALSGVDYTLEFTADGYNWQSYTEAIQDTATNRYYGWRITFNESTKLYAGEQLEINYSSTPESDSLNSESTFINTSWLNEKNVTTSVSYKPSFVKLDSNGRPGTTNIQNNSGELGWYIRVRPDADATSFTITDYLPKSATATYDDGSTATVDLMLKKLGISWSKQNVSSAEGTIDVGTYILSYTIDGSEGKDYRKITFTVKTKDDSSFGADNQIDIYVGCQIDTDKLPDDGASMTVSFTNTAEMNGVKSDQTQNLTVTSKKHVIKSDASNWQSGDTEHKYDPNNPTMSWFVEVNLPNTISDELAKQTIKITDTLPEGVTLTKLGIGTSQWNARETSAIEVGTSASGTLPDSANDLSATYSLSDCELTVEVTLNENSDGAVKTSSRTIYLYLECKVNDDAKFENSGEYTESCTFKNEVSVEWDKPYGEDDQTQTIYKDSSSDTVDKTVHWDNGIRQLQYAVLINKKGEDLAEKDDILDVEDILSYSYNPWWNTQNLKLLASSVQLYYAKTDKEGNVLYDSNGQPLVGDAVDGSLWSWTFEDNFAEVSGGGTVNYKIKATVPDKEKLVLKYIYAYSVELGDYQTTTDISVRNSVTVQGSKLSKDETSSNDKYVDEGTSGSATSAGTYTIYKVDENNFAIHLKGAEFTVYQYADDEILLDSEGNPVKYVTDEDGVILVSKGKGYFTDGVVYYLTETKSPDGYILPTEPVRIYFYFSGDESVQDDIPESAIDLSKNFGEYYAKNEKVENKLVVLKKWVDANGKEISSSELEETKITFVLWQTDIAGNRVKFTTDMLETEGANNFFEITSDNDWKITIPGVSLNDTNGNPYTYTVEEIAVWRGDSKSEVEYTTSVSTDSEGQIVLTNHAPKEPGKVTVQKAWKDGASGSSVKVQLYQSVDTVKTEYTAELNFGDYDWNPQVGFEGIMHYSTPVTGAGTYSFLWKMSDYGFKDTQGIAAFFISIFDPYKDVYDNFTLSGLTIKTNGEDVALKKIPELQYDNGYTRINIYLNGGSDVLDNPGSFVINEDGSLYVEFELKAKVGGYTLPALSVVTPNASGGVAYGEPIELNGDNGWSYTWDKLPLEGTDANGNLVNYSYYVKELTTGYDVTYSNSKGGYLAVKTSSDNGNLVITNSPRTPGDLTIEKKWEDMNGSSIAAMENSVDVDLYTRRRVLIENTGWAEQITVSNPEIVNGDVITFKFLGFKQNVGDDGEHLTWVTDSRYSTTDLPDGWSIKDNGWVGNVDRGGWENDTTEIHEYEVTVKVSDLTDKISILTGRNVVGPYTFTSNNSSYKNSDSFYLGIQSASDIVITKSTDEEQIENDWILSGTYTLSVSNDWKLTVNDLTPGTYKIVEKDLGYRVKYHVGEKETNIINITSDTTASATVTNISETTSITVNKSWLDTGENGQRMIAFRIYQDGKLYSTDVYKIEAASGWTITIDGLPKYSNVKDDNGDFIAYKYSVKEESILGYKPSYSTNNDAGINGGTLTIVNERVTSISAVKSWADGTEKKSVRLELWRYAADTEGEKYTLPVTSDGALDYDSLSENANTAFVKLAYSSGGVTFDDLPLYEFGADGKVSKYYSYFIVEVTNGGYRVGYSESSFITSGTITITNESPKTSITVNKNWASYITESEKNAVPFQLYQVYTPVDISSPEKHTHSFGAEETVFSATCTTSGYTYHTCSCGYSEIVSILAPTGHSWKKAENQEGVADGKTKFVCDNCGETLVENHTHTWDAGKLTTAPTCTKAGVKTFTCLTCGEEKTEEVAAQGHDWSGWKTTKEPTQSEVGIEERHCNRTDCTATDSREIAKLPSDVVTTILSESHYTGEWGENSFSTTFGAHDISSGKSDDYLTVKLITDNARWVYVKIGMQNVYYIDTLKESVTVKLGYDEIVSKAYLGSDVDLTNITLEIGGENVTIESVTWTSVNASASEVMLLAAEAESSIPSSTTTEGGVAYGKTVTIGSAVNWTHTWSDLPVYKYDENGNIVGYYTYYVVETGADKYKPTFDYGSGSIDKDSMSSAIPGGTITVTNNMDYRYELPETGGSGTHLYTLGGALICSLCALLLYNEKRRRKGATH